MEYVLSILLLQFCQNKVSSLEHNRKVMLGYLLCILSLLMCLWLEVKYQQSRMKVVTAYLLAVLGGNSSPSSNDIKNILAAGDI
ncbi:hypothetical protein VNO78_26960 [Psophocarpus tetragonolobus]|uniref:Uncharacterized protein n=1 Tax=Psophocarpus tetragonolobus TaxID=3891 RepID=A0AAN9XAE9_PSOTE